MCQSKLFARVFDTTTVITAISIFSFSATQIASPNQSVQLDIMVQHDSIRIRVATNSKTQQELLCKLNQYLP